MANPIINSPKPTKQLDENSYLLLMMNEHSKIIDLSFKMFPLVFEKHILPMIVECNNMGELLCCITLLSVNNSRNIMPS